MLLARDGIHVTLIEQHRFPRDKVCGECLSALGIDVLARLRLTANIEAQRPVELRKALLFSPDGSRSELTLPRPMWGISRRRFDSALLNGARESGATLFQPARCESTGPPVIVRHLETNLIEEVESDFVLVADGKGPATSDFGLKAHFVDVDAPSDAIELFGVRGHYGGVAPIEDSRWNVAFSVPGRRLRASGGRLEDLFAQIIRENAELSRQMRRARRVSDWLVSPLPRAGVQRDWPPRVIPIGNAAASLEPIGGEGMGLAMRSAELAAEMLINSRGETRAVMILQQEYRRLWNLRRLACRGAALLVSSPTVAQAITGCAADDNSLTALALRLIGKTSAAELEAPAARPVLHA
jgi:flavin-dependent dehydrogenase